MYRTLFVAALVCLPMVTSHAADNNSDNEVDLLKQELLELKQLYQEKLQLLEERIAQVEKRAQQASISAQRAENVAKTSLAENTSDSATSNFNPDFSVIFSGVYAAYDNDPEEYSLEGFQLGGESGLSPEGFSVEHTELVMSANIDDKFFGYLTLALASEGSEVFTELEEAFVETTSLDNGLKVKLGRFYSDIGYLNKKHGHSWDFVDQALVYDAFMGGNYYDDGIQLTWLAPTDLYTLIGVEAFRGNRFPAGGAGADEFGAMTTYLKLGGDWGTAHSWQAGISFWTADLEEREGGGHAGHGGEEAAGDTHAGEVAAIAGDSDLTILEFVYKWAPNGNPTDQNFVFQTEYFDRDESGQVWLEGSEPLEISPFATNQTGYYLQGVYQFIPQWRVGLRYDSIKATPDMNWPGVDEEVIEESGLHAEDSYDRWSLMLDWSNSEYSRFRIQYSKQDLHGMTDNQWYFQYLMSMGAHGAHSY